MVNKYTLFTIVSLMFFLNGCVIKKPSSNQKFIYLERVFKINSTAAAIRPISKNAQLDLCNYSIDFDISNMGGNGKFEVSAISEFSEILDEMSSIKGVKWKNRYGKNMLSICLPEKVLYVSTYRVELFGVVMDISSKEIEELNKKLFQIVLVRDIVDNNISAHKNYSEDSHKNDNLMHEEKGELFEDNNYYSEDSYKDDDLIREEKGELFEDDNYYSEDDWYDNYYDSLNTSNIMSNDSNSTIIKKVTKKKSKKNPKIRKGKKKVKIKKVTKKKFEKKAKIKKVTKEISKSKTEEPTGPLVKALVGKALDLKKIKSKVSANKKFREGDIIKIYVSLEGGNSRYSSKKSSDGKFAFYGLRKSVKGSVPIYECKFINGAYVYSINEKYVQAFCSLDTSPKIVFYELQRYLKKYKEVVQYFKGGDNTDKIEFSYGYRKNAPPLEKGVTEFEAWRAPK